MRNDESSGESIFDLPLTARDLFESLTLPDQQRLSFLRHHHIIEKDARVFSSGETPQNIYILRKGQAVLRTGRRESGSLAGPDRPEPIFGVIEALSESQFDITLTTTTTCEFDIIAREDFLDLLIDQPGICLSLVKILSIRYKRILSQITGH